MSLTEKNSENVLKGSLVYFVPKLLQKQKGLKLDFKPYQQELLFFRYMTSLNGQYKRNEGYKKCEKGEKTDRRKKRETTMSRTGCSTDMNQSQMCANMTKDFINQIIFPIISTNKSDLFIYIHIV